VNVGQLGGLDDLLHSHLPIVVTVGDVLSDGAVKEDRFLADDPELRSQPRQGDRRDVTSIQRDGTGERIVQALQQLNTSRFAATALAHEGHHLTRLHD